MSKKQRILVAIVDYKAGNLFSVEQACKIVGLNPVITSKPAEVLKADAVILPGVGAFGEAMKNLSDLGLIQPLKDFTASGKPFMGVCLGMQLLFTKSEEFGECKGLNLIEGDVVEFPSINYNDEKIKVPQVGWNRIFCPLGLNEKWNHTPLEDIMDGEFMYFVHSFYTRPSNPGDILSVTDYEGVKYCSSVIKNNIFATQFHPEKSAGEGLKIYRYWASKVAGFSAINEELTWRN